MAHGQDSTVARATKIAYHCPVCGEYKGVADLRVIDGINDWLWWCAKCINGKGMAGRAYMVALERSTGMAWSWLKAVGPEVADFHVREIDPDGVPELPSIGSTLGWHSRLLSEPEPLDWLIEHRGISPKVIEEEQIGWAERWNALTFPMFSSAGELVAYKTREIRPGAQMVNCKGHGRSWPLYPGVRDVAERKGWVLLLAGELDALRARTAYLPGVSVTLGAGTWRDEWADELRNYPVVVCFDNNESQQARDRVRNLCAQGITASQLDLRVLGFRTEKGDLSDYLNAGGPPGAIRRAAPNGARRRSRPRKAGKPRPGHFRGPQRSGKQP